MASLEQLDAIATGVVGLAAGGVILAIVGPMFWQNLGQAMRQQEVVGTVVAQEKTEVCQRTGRSNPWRCDRRVVEPCPIVQYQPETGEPLKRKDCSLRLKIGEPVYVLYDQQMPTDARINITSGSSYHWIPVFLSGVPVGVGGLLLIIGSCKLWEGTRGWQR